MRLFFHALVHFLGLLFFGTITILWLAGVLPFETIHTLFLGSIEFSAFPRNEKGKQKRSMSWEALY